MPTRSINQGFTDFHSRLTPGSYASGKAASHKGSITQRLKDDFDLYQLYYSGSVNNGTSIAQHSDVDFFAWIPSAKLKMNSATSLREVKDSLKGRFPRTSIWIDSPAVVLSFGGGDWDKAEVIPAKYVGEEDGKSVYRIPDGSGGWMKSSPKVHNSYVADENTRLKKKLKALIRFAKAWKYYRDVPISSFYLELRITKWMEEESAIIYDMDMNSIFRKLHACKLAAIQDPKGVSGLVYACSSDAKKETALSRLATAKTRAQKARDAERAENTKDAFYWWNLVFAEKFPSYCY